MEFDLPFLSFPEHISSRFDSLYQWLSRKYSLRQEPVIINDKRYHIFVIADVDAALETAIEEHHPTDANNPYWISLWHSAIGLAGFLSLAIPLKDKTILELGCGVGLVGIVAGNLGARVVLSDAEPDALRLAELNWIINLGTIPDILQLDWRKPPPNAQFELIIASDVAYEPLLFTPLVTLFQSVLLPGGEIYLSEPNRPIARSFFQMLETAGFRIKSFSRKVAYSNLEIGISIHRITRKVN